MGQSGDFAPKSGAKWKEGNGKTGTYEHALDTKSRLSMPARLREEIGDVFHLAMGADECLTIYPQAAWEELCRRADELEEEEDREAMEVFFAQAGVFLGERTDNVTARHGFPPRRHRCQARS